MNRRSVAEVARLLGTSRARITRAASDLAVGTLVGDRRGFTDADISTLTRHLGATPIVDGLSRIEATVLAELSRRPLGLHSARAVARACSLSPASASKAVRSLLEHGLATAEPEVIAAGGARTATVIRANVRHPSWSSLLEQLNRVRPAAADPDSTSRLPSRLRHAFWNVDDLTYGNLDVVTDGAYVAARALTTDDPALLSFAASHLRRSAWRQASRIRGVPPAKRAMALRLGV